MIASSDTGPIELAVGGTFWYHSVAATGVYRPSEKRSTMDFICSSWYHFDGICGNGFFRRSACEVRSPLMTVYAFANKSLIARGLLYTLNQIETNSDLFGIPRLQPFNDQLAR